MTSLARGAALGVSNPGLVFVASVEGKSVDLIALSWEVFDVHDDEKRLAPVSIASGTTDLVSDRLGLGRYAIAWTVPVDAQIGRHEIRYAYRHTGDTSDRTARVEFEIVEHATIPGPSYLTVADLRDEGLSCGKVTTARAQVAIAIASQLIERATGRYFEVRHLTIRLNGPENRMCLLGDPVISVDRVALDTEPDMIGDLQVEPSNYRVFSRHLSQGLLNPDDRENPKIEFVHARDLYGIASPVRFRPATSFSLLSGAFPSGVQNVEIVGSFGYTEHVAGGPPWGVTPLLIKHAAKLLSFREVKTLANVDCRQDSRDRWRIVEEKTRDQSYKLAQPRKFGSQLTGDAEIDSILTMFARPPDLGRV